MTTEQKAKAYDEALALMVDCVPDEDGLVHVRPHEIFSELAESEDEKIRKELIDAINGLWANDALPMPLSVKRKDNWIAWLEKQGKKPQVDGFDAELNALLKKYEHLPYDETIEYLEYYIGVLINMRNKEMEEQQ